MATDYTNPEMIGLERQRALSQMLLKQGMQTPQGQMIGNIYVGASPWQFLGNLAQQYIGSKIGETADTEQIALAQKLKSLGSSESADVLNTLIGQPAHPELIQQGPTQTGGNIPVQPAMAEQAPNPMAALLKAQASQSPEGRAYIAPLLANAIPKKTEQQINFEAAKADGFKGSFTDFKNQMNEYQKEELKIQKQRLALESANANKGQIVETPQGVVLVNPKNAQVTPLNFNGQPLMGKNPMNETQAKASLYQGTMLNSTKEMQDLEKSGFNPSSFKNQASLTMGSTALGNTMMPEDAQRYKQASDAFANAYIRFQSGAGINMDEIQRNLKNMMPSLGDKPGQIEQKQRAREESIRLMGNVAGPGNQLAYKNQNLTQPNLPAQTAPVAQQQPLSFANEAAIPPNLPKGTKVIINGVSGTWN